jgi:hypothetical protein
MLFFYGGPETHLRKSFPLLLTLEWHCDQVMVHIFPLAGRGPSGSVVLFLPRLSKCITDLLRLFAHYKALWGRGSITISCALYAFYEISIFSSCIRLQILSRATERLAPDLRKDNPLPVVVSCRLVHQLFRTSGGCQKAS